MKKLLIILLFVCFSVNVFANEIQSTTSSSSSIIVWNDKDEHGCIGSAWYTWNESKKECVRSWEDGMGCWEAKDEKWNVIMNEWTWWPLMVCTDKIMPWSDRDEHGCIGSAWYTWSETKKECVRPWEEENSEPKICTKEYNPVCWADGVSYSNPCMAWNKVVLYKWQCRELVNVNLFKKYKKQESKFQKSLEKLSTETLEKSIIVADDMLEQTKLMKFSQSNLEKYVTKIIFVKNLFQNELNNR